MLDLPNHPTALFTADSDMTQSAFAVLAERGLRTPAEVSPLGAPRRR